MDWAAALKNTGDDKALLAELAAMFVEDFPRIAGEARAAVAQNDMEALSRSAHTLKGRMAFFGVEPIRRQAAAVEELGWRTGVGAQEAGEALEALLQATAEVLPEFQSLSRT
jgi:HPt (histidine-containing phosphotransfer) domain-containing protein